MLLRTTASRRSDVNLKHAFCAPHTCYLVYLLPRFEKPENNRLVVRDKAACHAISTDKQTSSLSGLWYIAEFMTPLRILILLSSTQNWQFVDDVATDNSVYNDLW